MNDPQAYADRLRLEGDFRAMDRELKEGRRREQQHLAELNDVRRREQQHLGEIERLRRERDALLARLSAPGW